MPNYFSVIPANVRYDGRLSLSGYKMYGEISACVNKDGYCETGNDYFAELYGITKNTVSKLINELKSYDHIKVVYDNGNKRKIYINDSRKDNLFVVEVKKEKKDEYTEQQLMMINEVYLAYPSKCPFSKRSTGKCQENKKKIEKLLRTKTKDYLLLSIKKYLDNCYKTKTYIKNFGTFLNNIPDPEEGDKKDGFGFKEFMSDM